MRIKRVRATTMTFGVISVLALILFPPLGFWMCIVTVFLFRSDRHRILQLQNAAKSQTDRKREREMILAYKSLP